MAGAELRADIWVSEYITPWDVYQHGITRILAHAKTSFQEMYIVESGAYGKALVLDGKWQSSEVDEFLYHEPLVQPAMIFHGAPKSVLILGGGEGATAREALRWKSVERVTMVDIDGEVVDACKEHLAVMHRGSFDDPRLEVIIGDALDLLDNDSRKWDVIISDLSDPIEEGPSFQLFTKEYFERARRVLAEDGFFVVQAGPVAPAEMGIHVRLVKTLETVYANVRSYASHVPTYASPWGFAVAANRPIPKMPEIARVDRLLGEQTDGKLALIDGETLLGMMQTPRHIRKAIEAETEVYTLAHPPKFFGKGHDS